ncbi:MAG: amidohydrolase family protein [Alphaproteobacteria bacterium]|nr:amidohydrolase family protein [Alphaproteobacteria bacterium]
MNTHDTIIRNGLVYDGTAGAPFEADIAIDGGVITLVGKVDGKGQNEIDAKGQIVTPGFVDIHTHYDGQAAWGDALDPSSLHGVTTAVMGNCGVGFAPVHEADHDRLIQLMEGVEDIPFPVLAQGLPWQWESFADYLDFLTPRRFDIDLAAQVPHAAMRVYVMGERGANREDATDEDIAKMADLAHDAVMAGALGFSTSRTLNHRSADGSPTPTLTASEKELQGIALGLKRAGRGTLQFVSDFDDMQAEMVMLRRLVEQSGRPLSVSIAQADSKPTLWRHLTDWLEQGDADGLPMRGQVGPRPVGVLLGLELTLNPLSGHPSFAKIAELPLAEKVAALRDTDFRTQLLSEEAGSENPFVRALLASFGKIFVLGDPPDYEPSADKTVAAIAKQRAISEVEVALDLMLQDDGRGVLYFPFLNFADGNLDSTRTMLESKASLPGLSDGGAHVGMICDGSFPTSLLTHWGRDRTRGPGLPLELLISKQTRDTAHWVGLHDRGILKAGYRADINVIDFDKLRLHLPEISYDLPAGGRRLMQRASGYSVTMVAGEVTYRDGRPTGAKPGKLVRGAQAAPTQKLAAE